MTVFQEKRYHQIDSMVGSVEAITWLSKGGITVEAMDQGVIDSFLASSVYAVIGVSPNRDKYGYKVYQDLKNGGYKVFAVNPGYESIEGEACYADLESLPEKPDVVDFVCPPKVTVKFLKSMMALGIEKAWIQPGAESVEAIEFCRNNGIEVLHDICVMVQRRKSISRELE